jgi:hypothetical protein
MRMYSNKVSATEKRQGRYNGKATRSLQMKSDKVATKEKRRGRYKWKATKSLQRKSDKVATNEKRQGRHNGKATRSYNLITKCFRVAQHLSRVLMSMPLPWLMPTDFSSSSKSPSEVSQWPSQS